MSKQVKCKSGIMGWQDRLRKVYSDYEDFDCHCVLYGIHTRLGYKTPVAAWNANPLIQGSVIPSDLRRVRAVRV